MSRTPDPWTWHPHLPGVTTAWLAHANGVTVRTIRRWRERSSPADVDITRITAKTGLAMALLRPAGAALPLWSRMAIAEFAHKGFSYSELADMFRCSPNTVWRSIRQISRLYAMPTGERLLTRQQRMPVGQGAD